MHWKLGLTFQGGGVVNIQFARGHLKASGCHLWALNSFLISPDDVKQTSCVLSFGEEYAPKNKSCLWVTNTEV